VPTLSDLSGPSLAGILAVTISHGKKRRSDLVPLIHELAGQVFDIEQGAVPLLAPDPAGGLAFVWQPTAAQRAQAAQQYLQHMAGIDRRRHRPTGVVMWAAIAVLLMTKRLEGLTTRESLAPVVREVWDAVVTVPTFGPLRPRRARWSTPW
jgi:hypothetical protein